MGGRRAVEDRGRLGILREPGLLPDGRTILTEGDGVLRFFDADSGRERYGLPEAHQAGVTLVRYAPDGRTIFTGGDDATLREWDAETARHLRVIPAGAGVSLLAISPDGRNLAT